MTTRQPKEITIAFTNGDKLKLEGVYFGQIRPDGILTKNWHYYGTKDGTILHIPKDKILYIETKED